jgi:phage terminase Nu1 subunit (DNA packaging protein)
MKSQAIRSFRTGLGVTQIYQLAQDGLLPKVPGGFKLEGVRNVVMKLRADLRSGGEKTERTRLIKVRADVEEAKMARLLGEVVPAETVVAMMSSIMTVIRTRILSLPSRYAPRIVQVATATEAAELIREEVTSILTYLAQAVEGVIAEISQRRHRPGS